MQAAQQYASPRPPAAARASPQRMDLEGDHPLPYRQVAPCHPREDRLDHTDLVGTRDDFTDACPLVDQQVRDATAGGEQFQDINNAYAAGYAQVTPYITGMGRHMILGGVPATLSQDAIFEPGVPESLLYEPDPSSPDGWRLGGVMYIIPEYLHPLPPDGFPVNTDPWHYHEDLCIWNNGNNVAEGVAEPTCLGLPGGTWFEKAGWLLHLWNYHLNPAGRFVEINDQLTQLPTVSNASIAIDADPNTTGVQSTRSTTSVTFTVDVVAANLAGIGAFNFDIVYNGNSFSAPTIGTGASVDRNPDAEQGFLQSTGRLLSCTPPAPVGNVPTGVADHILSARVRTMVERVAKPGKAARVDPLTEDASSGHA